MKSTALNLSISTRIKELRGEKGLTQIQAAALLNIDKSTIAKYETGAATPSVHVLISLADFFDVSLDYLTGRED
ncbi:MAG: helix-turn-helix domain-containing protein [Firmicutes bacterium]|nr:helix-turn-helix domain-containing protein [Bacillota bacterium]